MSMSRLQKTFLLLFLVFFGGVLFILSLPRETENSSFDQAIHSTNGDDAVNDQTGE